MVVAALVIPVHGQRPDHEEAVKQDHLTGYKAYVDAGTRKCVGWHAQR